MKWLIVIIALNGLPDVNRIAKTNRLIREAGTAYIAGNYSEAVEKYKTLIDSLDYEEEEAVLNLAHALYKTGQKEDASLYYDRILKSKNQSLSSTANQQLGVLAYENQKQEQALEYFKSALKANPQNEEARYNYELVKKAMQRDESSGKDQQEPSEYAKKLRQQAEMLVRQGRYMEAFQLMQNGLTVDKTVSAYQDFIKRTGDIAEIDEKY